MQCMFKESKLMVKQNGPKITFNIFLLSKHFLKDHNMFIVRNEKQAS